MKIAVKYTAVDGFRQRRTFATLAGAQRFAQKWVGETPELGRFYAVSGDGVGKITAEFYCDGGALSLADLFPKLAPAASRAPKPERGYDGDYVVDPYGEFYGERD